MDAKRRTVLIAVAILISILLSAALVWMIHIDNQKAAAQAVRLQELSDRLLPYKQEKGELLAELSRLQSDYTYASESAQLMIGFLVTDISDISYIREKAEAHGFTPVLMVECTQPVELVMQWIAAADPSWEILLCASNYTSADNAQIRQLRLNMQAIGRQDTDILHLRPNAMGDSIGEVLKECDMAGYTNYHSTPTSGQDPDGSVYIDYSYFSAENFSEQALESLDNRLEAWYFNRAAMLCILDMSVLNSGDIPDSQVEAVLQKLLDAAAGDFCANPSMAEVVAELMQINAIEEAYAEKIAARTQELNARLAELTALIDELYLSASTVPVA